MAAVGGALLVLFVMQQRSQIAEDRESIASAIARVPGTGTKGDGNVAPPVDGWPSERLPPVASFGGPEDFGRVEAIAHDGHHLFLIDRLMAPHIVVLDPSRDTVLLRFGSQGEGPGEFRQASTLRVVGDEPGRVYVHDFASRRITEFSVRPDGMDVEILGETVLAIPTTTERPFRYSQGWVASGLFGDDAVLMFFDPLGQPVRRTGRPPFSLEDVGHGTGVRLLNRSYMVPHPAGERFAVGFYSSNRVDIYDSEGRLLSSTAGPGALNVEFRVSDEGRFFWEEGNELAYTSMAANRTHIFALRCDCPLRFGDEEGADTRRRLHVWTWEGSFVGEYDLTLDGISALAASHDGTGLYGGVEDPYPRVMYWQLPKELVGGR